LSSRGTFVGEIRDKDGRAFQVVASGNEGLRMLEDFYNAFEPKGNYQGIPPTNKRDRFQWIKGLMAGSRNYLIFHGSELVGHVAVTCGGESLHELIIFLHENYRGKGIGTETLRHIRDLLAHEGYEKIWLTVQSTNMPAIRCFRKVGFQFTSPLLEPERDMVLGSGEEK
jgi:RimJ/RimL family protein N-acetyltransferase